MTGGVGTKSLETLRVVQELEDDWVSAVYAVARSRAAIDASHCSHDMQVEIVRS